MAKVLSMTGFARSEISSEGRKFIWEVKSVNGKGLDVRFRMPGGFETLDLQGRKLIDRKLARGNLTANLSVQQENAGTGYSINRELLASLYDVVSELAAEKSAPAPRMDVLATARGVVESQESAQSAPQWTEADQQAALSSLEQAVIELIAMREQEGEALKALLSGFVDDVRCLTAKARDRAAERPELYLQRLRDGITRLTREDERFDHERLGQEAVLLAAKADIREELDRLDAHCDAADKLLTAGGPIGRKFDFLCQEFNREANTLCSKANDTVLTSTGMELKAVVEQMREQVQNVE